MKIYFADSIRGDREDLDQYIKYLKRGPVFARFDEVILNWEAEDKAYNDFQILR